MVSAYVFVLRVHTNTHLNYSGMFFEGYFFRIVEAVSAREGCFLWFVICWNSYLRVPCSNVNVNKQTYFQISLFQASDAM